MPEGDWLDEDEDAVELGDEVDAEVADWLRLQAPADGDMVTSSGWGVGDFMASLNEDGSPRHFRGEVVPAGTDEKLARQIALVRGLQPQQRIFIRCLLQTASSIREAVSLYNARYSPKINHGQAVNWNRKSNFVLALAAAKEHVLGIAGVDATSVLLKSQRVYEDAMTPVPILHKGRHTGFFEQDRASAMRAIEFQGRANGMTKEADGARVTVQIVNLSRREKPEAQVVSDG